MGNTESTIEKFLSGFETKPLTQILKLIGLIAIFLAFIALIGYAFGWFGEAGQVAQEEFGPRASVDKYEYFVETSEVLDAKIMMIEQKKGQIAELEKAYEGMKRNEWTRTDLQSHSQWSQELSGMKISYNNLVAEYNAKSREFTWSQYNTDSLRVTYQTFE